MTTKPPEASQILKQNFGVAVSISELRAIAKLGKAQPDLRREVLRHIEEVGEFEREQGAAATRAAVEAASRSAHWTMVAAWVSAASAALSLISLLVSLLLKN